MKIGSSGNTQDLVTGVGLGSSAGGDVGGTLPGGTIVEGIQGVPVDVDAATPADRDALIYEAGTGWIADHVQAEDVVYDPTASGSPETDVQGELDRLEVLVAAAGSAGALDDLTDVVISSPATADRLRFDGALWRNSALVWTPLTVLDPTTGNYLPLVDGSGNQIMAEV